jgi:hypothetical protein
MHWTELIASLAVWNAASFALDTLPIPDNKWARWAVGVAQFFVANRQKMLEAFRGGGK